MSIASSQSQIQEAAGILKRGGIIVFPTDTSYGLGGEFDNAQVIKRILDVKHRTNDRFTIVAASLEQAVHFFPEILTGKALELATQYWPGPLSIAVGEKYSVRVPDKATARALAESVGKPIIATSANRSGQPSTYSIEDAQNELGKENVDMWIDSGILPERPASTIITVSNDKVTVLREGAVHIPTS